MANFTPLRTRRPIREVYLAAAKAAMSLYARAQKVADESIDLKDKQTCKDIAFSSINFAKRVQKQADIVIGFMNDGTLRAVCEGFDPTFRDFMVQSEQFEDQLDDIESRNMILPSNS